MGIRIILAEDHGLIREGIFSMFEKNKDYDVISMAKNGREAVRQVRDLKPDIVIMDISMPELNGIEATRIIKSEFPSVEVIALSAHCDKSHIMQMLKAGARGYILKDSVFEELVMAVCQVYGGEIFLGRLVSEIVVKDYISIVTEAKTGCLDGLTSREREVLQLIAEGNKTSNIAKELNVSVKTVETHRQRIMKKLNIFSVANLTRVAIMEGLTTLDITFKMENFQS